MIIMSTISKFRKFGRYGVRAPLLLFIMMNVFFSIDLRLNYSYSKDGSFHTIVLNLDGRNDHKFIYSWHDAITIKQIFRWGRSEGIELFDDSAPVVDQRARFISKFGSKIKVSNLKSDRKYRIWIDFVHFHGVGDGDIISRLEVFMDERLVKTLNFGDIGKNNNPYKLEIPYELSADGNVEIVFKEHSPMGGFWGIWDLVISDSDELLHGLLRGADGDKTDKGIRIKDGIVEIEKKHIRRKPEKHKRDKILR